MERVDGLQLMDIDTIQASQERVVIKSKLQRIFWSAVVNTDYKVRIIESPKSKVPYYDEVFGTIFPRLQEESKYVNDETSWYKFINYLRMVLQNFKDMEETMIKSKNFTVIPEYRGNIKNYKLFNKIGPKKYLRYKTLLQEI